MIGSTYRKGLKRFNDRVAQDAPRYLEIDAFVGQRLSVPENEFQSVRVNIFRDILMLERASYYHTTGAYKNPMKDGLVNSINMNIRLILAITTF